MSTQKKHQKTLQQFNQVITIIGVQKFALTTRHKTFHFGLPKDVEETLKHEVDSLIKHNKPLAEHTIK